MGVMLPRTTTIPGLHRLEQRLSEKTLAALAWSARSPLALDDQPLSTSLNIR